MLSSTLHLPEQRVLTDLFSWFVSALNNDIETSLAARTERLEQERLGVYFQPRMSFVHTASIKGFGRPKEGHAQARDFNIRRLCCVSARLEPPKRPSATPNSETTCPRQTTALTLMSLSAAEREPVPIREIRPSPWCHL